MAELPGASDSAFEKKVTEQTAVSAFQLAWGIVKKIGLKGWEQKQVRAAMKKYTTNYRERHGEVKVLGMSQPVPLHQIYTAVRVVKPHYLHLFTTPDEMEESFRESGHRHSHFGEEESRDGIGVANEVSFLNVLGAPGAGKSTFLRRLGQEAMLARSTDEKVGRDKRLNSRYEHTQLPVLLELRRFRDDGAGIDLLAALVEEFSVCEFPKSREFVTGALQKGALLVILDGLDEVPDKRLDEMIEAVRDLVDRYSENRFITSCRTAHYKNYFKKFTDVVLADFGDEQIRQFVGNWFATAEDLRDKTAERCLEQLESERNASARELARTPLLLTFLCLTFGRDQSLPPTRATLYRRALDILLQEWAAEKRVHNEPVYQELNTDLEIDMLAEMAARFFLENRYFFSRDEALTGIREFMGRQLKQPPTLDAGKILEAIEVQQGLIVRRAADAYSFSHLTIQEYLTARELSRGERWADVIDQHLFEKKADRRLSFGERWREVFILMAGMGDADELLEAIAGAIQEACCGPESSNATQQTVKWIARMANPDPSLEANRRLAGRLVILSHALSLHAFYDAGLDGLGFDGRGLLDRLNITFDLDLARDLGLALDPGFDFDLDLDLALAPAATRTLDLDLARDLIKISLDHDLVLPATREIFETARRRLADSESDIAISASVREILGLPELTSGELNDLLAFLPILEACRLVVDCRDAAYRLSTEAWERVCNRLLTVPEELPTNEPDSPE